MGTAPAKWILLAAIATALFLEIYWADGAPTKRCFLGHYSPQTVIKPFRNARNKYEDLRRQSQPWRNCSGEHLKWPQGTLNKLTVWEKREAVLTELNLIIPVLQNHTQPTFSEDVKKVLEYLMPLRESLVACIKEKPSDHEASGHLHGFQEELRRFQTNNVQQSPECLEVAVGMNLFRLLTRDIKQITQRQEFSN